MIDILRYHKLTDRDRQAPLLEIYNEGKQDVAAAASDLKVYHTAIPLDQILIVASWCVNMINDGGSIIQAVYGASFNLGGTQYFDGLNVAFNEWDVSQLYLSNRMPIVILSEEIPTVQGFWTVAGNHTLHSRLRGWLIPKGNMGRGFGGL